MSLALPVVGALALGLVLGGRLGKLAELPLRATWLFFVAIALQVVAFPFAFLPWRTDAGVASLLWLISAVRRLVARWRTKAPATNAAPIPRSRWILASRLASLAALVFVLFLVAMLIMLPVLTILANVSSILGAALYCSPTLDVSVGAYVVQTLNSLDPGDLGQGLAKSFVFAALITLVGVSTGFSVTGGAEGVGRATTRAVVLSISALVIADMMFSYFLNR